MEFFSSFKESNFYVANFHFLLFRWNLSLFSLSTIKDEIADCNVECMVNSLITCKFEVIIKNRCMNSYYEFEVEKSKCRRTN